MERLSIGRSNYTLVALLFIVTFSLTLLNCEKKEPPPPPPPPPAAPATVEKSIEERVSDLESELFIIKLSTEVLPTETAVIGPEGKGYATVITNYGTFIIKLNGVTPYLDGYKIKVQIGNITSATFNGFKLNVRWKNGNKQIDFTETLNPGANKTVEFSVTPAKPEDIKRIYIGLELNQIGLRRG